ncbi:MAG: hypothetical protein U5L96_16530 [Owenweeksia sp.]|nr:hypothetical protein [Owenweeksia sp.]
MKKIILSSIICLGSYAMLATHLMGGEITVQNIGNGNHLVTLLVYRDTIGIPMDTNVTFHFSNTQGANHSLTTGYDSIISGNLLPMYPYGVEVYLFIDTISFLSPGLWEVYQEDCCRNAAIQNLSHPLGESMVLKSSLMVNATSSNSSPFFLVPAAIFLPINTLWQYNPLPFDPDGDSLSWRLDTPLTKFNQYCAGYTNPGADPTNPSPMTIDPVTGTITWTAKRIGNTVASILVDQHRNGQYMGHIRRDMQFIVVDTNQGFPTWQNLSMLPLDGSNHYAYDIRPGQAFKMELIAGHSDSSKMQNLSMTAYSELLQDPQFGASFITSVQAGNLKGSFSWQPPASPSPQHPLLVGVSRE